jgi:UDP-glucose 4-epimerase
VRDYIHVMDLAEGHLAALNFLRKKLGLHVFNLGTGKGSSVLELVKAFEEVSGKSIPLKIANRRAGDVATCYAKVDKSNVDLSWKATLTLREMCSSSWASQEKL